MQDKKQRTKIKKNGQMLTDFGINLNLMSTICVIIILEGETKPCRAEENI